MNGLRAVGLAALWAGVGAIGSAALATPTTGRGAPIIAIPPGARSAAPLTNPATWVTTQDYPPQALRDGAEGVTDFKLEIGPDGRVSACWITASSGSPTLDQTTCHQVTMRARFAPAVTAEGQPVVGHYANRVRWTIPRPPVPQAGELTLSYLVQPDGTRSDCRVEAATGGAAKLGGTADPCRAGSFSGGYVDEAGKPVARRVRSTVRIEVLPVP